MKLGSGAWFGNGTRALIGVAAACAVAGIAYGVHARLQDPVYTPPSPRTRPSVEALMALHHITVASGNDDHVDVAALPPETVPVVVLSTRGLYLGAEEIVPSSSGSEGFDARYKRNGANDLYIMKLAAALGDWRNRAEDAGLPTDELCVLSDKTASPRALREILFTAGQVGFSRFAFVTSVDGKIVTVRIGAPAAR